MMIKRMGAMFLALIMCMGMFSTTAFAYADETVATVDATEATDPVDTDAVEDATEENGDELPYSFTITEDGTIVYLSTERNLNTTWMPKKARPPARWSLAVLA